MKQFCSLTSLAVVSVTGAIMVAWRRYGFPAPKRPVPTSTCTSCPRLPDLRALWIGAPVRGRL